MSERPTTPPRNIASSNEPPVTPEQTRLVEINRLKGSRVRRDIATPDHQFANYSCVAKAKQRERDEAAHASGSNSVNQNNKRPLMPIPVESRSPTGPMQKEKEKPLKRDSRLGKYFEYD